MIHVGLFHKSSESRTFLCDVNSRKVGYFHVCAMLLGQSGEGLALCFFHVHTDPMPCPCHPTHDRLVLANWVQSLPCSQAKGWTDKEATRQQRSFNGLPTAGANLTDVGPVHVLVAITSQGLGPLECLPSTCAPSPNFLSVRGNEKWSLQFLQSHLNFLFLGSFATEWKEFWHCSL